MGRDGRYPAGHDLGTLRPQDIVIREVYRSEGVSDPDEMEVLYCPQGDMIWAYSMRS